ncbi:MAG: hypothetical protein K1X67_22945 [Fimbriimonadaceae bacterium]|nr:hypothetical protein [Fimbriimonadaceae bacterium]
MRANFYPRRQSKRVQWHAQFAASLASYAGVLGIPAPVVAQAQVDAQNVALFLAAFEAATNYRNEVLAFKDQMMEGLLNTPTPPAPTPPAAIVLPVGTLGNIEARTRRLVAEIKANPAFTRQMGVDMGIIATPTQLSTPSVAAAALTGSRIALRVKKGGYAVVLLMRSRDGVNWERIGVLDSATFIDDGPPLEDQKPEERHYRVQGYAKNAPVGEYSNVVTVVTIP